MLFHKQDVFEKLGHIDVDSILDDEYADPTPTLREQAEGIVDVAKAKRLTRQVAKKVSHDVRESSFPTVLENVKLTRRFNAAKKAKQEAASS